MRKSSSFLQALLMVGCLMSSPTAAEFADFVTADGDRLLADGKPLRFLSWNIPNLLTIEDAFGFLDESPWRWPNEFEIADALESVRQMGGTVVRTYVITVRREGSDMGDHVHVLAPGKFNEKAFRTLDLVLKIANEKQVRVIIPLVDNWKWMGGIEQYAAFRGKEAKEFWSDHEIKEDFKQTIAYVLGRRNSLTGVPYRQDKAVLAWETGNEIDATPEWTREMAAYIKQLDPNHLVIDGRSLHGLTTTSLDDPNIDVLTTHHYPGPDRDMVGDIQRAAAEVAGRKPYFIGEFGFIPADDTARVINTILETSACGALTWSLRFHRREGGFYWHDEPAGGNFYKAFHWPGFASGAAYEETRVVNLMREAAFKIRGLPIPPRSAPAAPHLLPITHPSLISWQGSAGAAAYSVQRATKADGPWQSLASDVSDAAVQYRPLYADESAEVGTDYFYRIVAHNEAGASPPSNIQGPITPQHRMLVDELEDLSRVAEHSGTLEPKSDKPRRCQEDIHRYLLGPDAAITYRLRSGVREVRAFVYSSVADPPLAIAASSDGRTYRELEVATEVNSREVGDYGYLTPVLLRARCTDPAARFVRIATQANGSPSADQWAEVQLSRVEMDYR